MALAMPHATVKYFMILLYVLCICYPVLGDTELGIQNVTAEGAFGKEAILKCIVVPHYITFWWLFEGLPVKYGERITQSLAAEDSGKVDRDGTKLFYLEVILKILNTSEVDVGNYTCVVETGQARSVTLDLSYPGTLVDSTEGPVEFNITESEPRPVLHLACTFEIYNQTKVEWIFRREGLEDIPLEATSNRDKDNPRLLKSSYSTPIAISLFDEQNGTYVCKVWDSHTLKYISGHTDVLIYAAPVLVIENAVAISSSQIFFNWTVKSYNSPIKRYDLSVISDREYTFSPEYRIDAKNTSYVMENLKNNTVYNIQLQVTTDFATSKPQHLPTPEHEVRTLSKDPIFVPNIYIYALSAKWITIGLTAPPRDIAEYVHYYLLEAWKKSHNETRREAVHLRDDRNLPFMFENLNPHSIYVVRARACSDYTRQCDAWSEELEALTLYGTPHNPTTVL